MFLVGIFSWWYGSGWVARAKAIKLSIGNMVDFFSIDILAKTLFNPYKQISAGSVDGPLEVKFRNFLDRTISRFIGAMIRSFMIIVGLIIIALQGVLGLLILIIWPIMPLMPVIGLILTVIGWLPWKS